ncbi:alpha/beta fold hydrolase [Persephonella sp.]
MRRLKIKKIFIHGWGFSNKIWVDFFNLENSVFLDLPYHGKNKKEYQSNVFEEFSEELYELIEKSDTDVILIGWSIGASISVITSLKNPRRLKKMILIGFSPKFKDSLTGSNPKFIKAFNISLRRNFEETVYQFRKSAVGKPFENIPIPEKEGSIRLLNEFIELDLRSSLNKIDIPVKLFHGKRDQIVNWKGSVFAEEGIKDSELFLVDSDHGLFLDNPNLIKDALV